MKRVWALFALLFLLAGLVPAALAQGPVEPTEVPEVSLSTSAPVGIENVGSSTLANVTPAQLPVNVSFDMCFTVLVQSPDAEYMDHFEVDLPDNWTVNSVAPDSVPPAQGCAGALPPVVGVAAGNVVYWQSTGYPPQTGCGAWNGGAGGTYFDFCANVTIPDTSGAPWMLPWWYVGDGWGAAPHEVAGNYGPVEPEQPLSLNPPYTFAEGCPCEPQDHVLVIVNNTGLTATVILTYTPIGDVEVFGPPNLPPIPDGSVFPFTITLVPGNVPPSTTVIVLIDALDTGSGLSDRAVIEKHVIGSMLGDDWENQPSTGANDGTQWAAYGATDHIYSIGGYNTILSQLIPTTRYYDEATGAWVDTGQNVPVPVDGPAGGGIVLGDNIWLLGGLDGGFVGYNAVQYYNTATNVWTTLPAPPWSARGGGFGGTANGNVYIMSGYNAAAGLTYNEVWEYNPGTAVWTQKDNFPYAGGIPPGPIFGCSVSMNWGGTDYIYVGGEYFGANDFWRFDPLQPAGSQWTQLANIPDPAGVMSPGCVEKHGMIYLYGGDLGAWSQRLDTMWVYDPNTDTWTGPLPQTLNTARLGHGAVLFDGALWTVAGSDGQTIHPATVERLEQIPCDRCWCIELDGVKMAPPEARNGERFTYEIVLDIAGPIDNVWMTDPLPPGVEFAGNLTWTEGFAWYEPVDNAVYWRPGPPPTPPGLAAMPAPNLVTPAPDLEGSGPVRFSDLAGGPLPTVPAPDNEPAAPEKVTILGLTYYGDRGTFDGDHPGLPIEGFDNTLVPPGNIIACDGPFDSSTNNACFSPGAILDGIRMDNVDPTLQMVVIGAGALGNPTPYVGPNTFVDHHDMTFFGADVYAVGFDLWSPLVATVFDVYIYGPGDVLLGQTTVAAGPTVVFWGVASDNEPITRIRTESADGELFDNVAFGGAQPLITVTFDVTVTGVCGDMIVNHAFLGCGGHDPITLTAVTRVGGEPDISVDPTALSTELCPDATAQESLSICNNGDCPLGWTIFELTPTAKLAGSMSFVPEDVASKGPAPDGLTVSSPSAGTSAPTAPANPEAVLWDQPLSAVNQNAYVNQAFPDFPDFSSFLADDFVSGGWWAIDTIFVPGGLWNGATDLNVVNSLTWQIYADSPITPGIPAGDPSGGGDPPVWTLTLPPFDPHVAISTGSGGYPSDTTLDLPGPIILPPGTWWLVFYPTEAFGTWGQYGRQPSDTTNGYTGQFINPGEGFGYGPDWQDWTVLGAAQQDIAFRLEGSVVPIGDIPWLSEDPISGTVLPGECAMVTVDFDATGLLPGDYYGGLLIVSNDPDTPTMTVPVTMTVNPLAVASFDYAPDTGYAPLTVYFTDTSMYAMNPVWEFGDGGTSTETNPMHTYDVPGVYTVTLTVDSVYGCGIDTASAIVTVMEVPCDPVQIITVTTDISLCVVTFGAELTGTAPFDYLWDFGAFGTSTETNPVVDFGATGAYSVTLEVSNCTTGYDTITFTVNVECVQLYYIYLPLVFKNYTAP